MYLAVEGMSCAMRLFINTIKITIYIKLGMSKCIIIIVSLIIYSNLLYNKVVFRD